MKIFCSGIGGIGLSAYASLQKHAGHDVSGSDRAESALTKTLVASGIAVSTKQDGSAVPADADLFVYSEAIAPDAPERMAAKTHGIRSIPYAQALGEMLKGKTLVAVCGTHGKSSTTAMAAQVLVEAGLDPTIVVGTKVPFLDGKNWRSGASNLALVEACEYKRSFHNFHPSIILMTTVDGDHFDDYASLDEYRASFATFLSMLPNNGVVVTHGSDAACMSVAKGSGRTVVDADALPEPKLNVPGAHMRSNARLVAAMAQQMKINPVNVQKSLKAFTGTWRRMEVKGTRTDGVTVIDDYGHHPAEIRATLAAMREAYAGRRIVCAFQPHTHDRTIKLYDDFTTAFRDADTVVLADIYEARLFKDTQRADIGRLTEDVAAGSGCVTFRGGTLEETEDLLERSVLRPGDVLVCMGAGDITALAATMAK